MSFIKSFLTKYEEVLKVDYFSSYKSLKSVKELRKLYNEDDDTITFSRGLLDIIPESEYIIEEEHEFSLVDPPIDPDKISKILNTFDLREDQVLAVIKSLYSKRGVIQLPTAVGKTAIITAIIKYLLQYNPSMRFLILAPTLLTVKNINSTLNKNGLDSSVFGHPNKYLSAITTSLVQSLVKSPNDNLVEQLSQVDAVIYDECLPAKSSILLANGSHMTIKEIYENDNISEVMSYNLELNKYETKKIIHKYRSSYNKKFSKVYYKSQGFSGGIVCTPNHKIYTINRGYVAAEDLVKGDLLKLDAPVCRDIVDYVVQVTKVSPNIGGVAPYKYNLEVEDNHNYFAEGILVSNCHHLKCDTWNKLNSLLPNVQYSLGFSALSIDKNEIYSKDIRDISYDSSLIIGSSGKVIMHMDASYYIKNHIIALPVVFRINNSILLPDNFDESNWSNLVKKGLMSTPRSVLISKLCNLFIKYNRKVLVLVNEKSYAYKICNILTNYLGITSYGISFGSGKGYIYHSILPTFSDKDTAPKVEFTPKDSFDIIQDFSEGKLNILLATSHADEGVDISNVDVCILAGGGKKDRRIIQRVGRALRKSKTGKYAYIVDFTDKGSRVLSRQSSQRLSTYKNILGIPNNLIYSSIDLENVESTFKNLEGLD